MRILFLFFAVSVAHAQNCEGSLAILSPQEQLDRVRAFAKQAHGNQRYGNHPYTKHLLDVAIVLNRFDYGDIRNPKNLALIEAAYLHDVFEDSKIASRDELRAQSSHIAMPEAVEAAWRVTDVPGFEDRKERKLATYPQIRGHEMATIIKLADRIANFEACIQDGNMRMINKYASEYNDFYGGVHVDGIAEPMWRYLQRLIARYA